MIIGLSKAWSALSYLLASLALLPFVMLIGQSLIWTESVFNHLLDTVLFSYLFNSLVLVLLVPFLALVMALPAAWLIARCEFPGRAFFRWVLLLPLAMPAYLVAYVYTDLLDYAGPVQGFLRLMFGWQSPDEYWFPEIRSLGGVSLILALVLFPYVYLLGRTAFMEQSAHLQQAVRLMGFNPWQCFWRFNLPMARPALAVGLALVAMETTADFATVSYFAVPTLTTAVYDAWLSYGSLTAAAKLSMLILFLVFGLIAIEQFARRRQQLFQRGDKSSMPDTYPLPAFNAWLATGYCSALLILAFGLPAGVLCRYAWDYFAGSWNDEFLQYILNSFILAASVSLICALVACLLLFVRRVSPSSADLLPARFASLGYALPGTVLAIGVLLPLTWADFALNDFYTLVGNKGPGLVFTGTIFALIFALCVRFIAIALGCIGSSYKNISPSIDMAAISIGQQPLTLLRRVHFPLLKKGIFIGMLLVFIEAMKELPAALLLRPVGYENLATHVFQFVSDEQLEQGALPAIVIVLVGLVPLIYLNRSADN